ncbi:membrane dipeptidase [uncultured Clostridium sp.]|uniref:dipeptidase n=1 Tax=uncultured Clostridium sp. TaxID=59620 RepID=UPI0026184046|nr:membrane dipeptidase [uncultured Clostridium sp.]
MKFIDLHCDTASRLFYEKDLSLRESICKVDIEKLKAGDALMQMFAFFIDLGEIKRSPFEEFSLMHENFMKELRKNKNEIEIFKDKIDLNKLYACLTIEEGEVLEGNPYNVEKVKDMGIKAITLTWNYENSIGYPNFEFKHKDEGLKKVGFDIVDEMERFNIVPDCSHLSDKGFWDLIEHTKKPFIATHSNSRSVQNHPRNLTDEMLKALGNKGGLTGINFCVDFVAPKEIAMVEDLVKHMVHIKNKAGIESLGLGSDFDGIENEVEIKDCSQMNILIEEMVKNNFTMDEIEKVFYKNAMRIFCK